MDQHLGGGLQVVRHRREVVALWVPAETADHVFEREGHHIVLELPNTVGLLLQRRFNLIILAGLDH